MFCNALQGEGSDKGLGGRLRRVRQLGAMTPMEVRSVLARAGYEVVRQRGSHARLECPGRPGLTLALHSRELSPRLVKKILVTDACLTPEELDDLLG